jgi:beta-glucosidase
VRAVRPRRARPPCAGAADPGPWHGASPGGEDRIRFTGDALAGLKAAIDGGADVRGYVHWSLLDNFEWMLGYRPTFGLVSVDRRSFARTPKPSLAWLGEVARRNGVA